eukprot:12647333-Prorocentrum_lima.AAC.1
MCDSPVVVRAGSAFVHDGLYLKGAAATTAAHAAWGHLWRWLWEVLLLKGGLSEDGLTVEKILGHATDAQVDSGKARLCDVDGMAVADRWAKKAACRVAPPLAAVED